METLWDHAPCGYFVTDANGVLTRVNTTLVDWLGYAADELIGRRTFDDLLTAPSRDAYDRHLASPQRADDRVEELELDLVTADGSRLSTRVAVMVEADDDGTPVAVRSIVIDEASTFGYEQALLDAEVRAGESETRAEALVRALQQTLIPPAPPSVPGLDVAAAYHPALGDVGGDFFDVFEVADADWCVVVGDVSGKGTGAAIVTSAARHTVRSSALRERVPSVLLQTLNSALVEHPTTRFCTVALLRLQKTHDAWVATMSSGGHPFPLLLRHGTTTPLGTPGSLVGFFDDVSFHDVSIKMASGDALVLYTDGVTEARNAAGELYGEERLHEAIAAASGSAQAIIDAVLAEVLAFQGDRSGDDIALVVIRRP